ncbi:UvrD-helicase domain-containing protein [Candidatus Schneideria nysicola]|uniref:UvrD-helicase domain-containing protein n=1 Tax=Candidatus Schneideria nysicola TaxID=1081631 RepID=UPI001CAA7DFD|nr:UvrD-helicase domain-containing protein [Candidatus Schneideria nysicola]UAJ65406.1 UvrD-helicase domain-containing protein [Candidatus Schneideria nysicola]
MLYKYDLLNGLNKKQYEAVTTSCNHVLVLAGAGSGKTRVLVHRIAWLLLEKKYLPSSIMAMTFTNKAASEIQKRIASLIDIKKNNMWIGTFHSLAYRILRIHYKEANLLQNFQVIDNQDQIKIIKKIIDLLKLNKNQYSADQVIKYISKKKDSGIQCFQEEIMLERIYHAYQKACEIANLVDFSDLLIRVNQLWINNPHILSYYQQRFVNILIDEFQDTNRIQYNWMYIIAKNNKNNVMVVGDDDQSIYSWRGAQISNIINFTKDFIPTKIIRLEQNYRSTGNILNAANILIAKNNTRFRKTLWTNDERGDPIYIYCASNELDEADFIIKSIHFALKSNLILLGECAILYRNNAQSRLLEEFLIRMKIPYLIYGSLRFFERQEIKDILAYLRLLINRNDDLSYERIINIPNRGIGPRTLEIIRCTAERNKINLWDSSCLLLQEKRLSPRSAYALNQFIQLINNLEQEIIHLPLPIQVEKVIRGSGLLTMYDRNQEKNQNRIDNIEELITAIKQYYNLYKDEKAPKFTLLHSYLNTLLLSEPEQTEDRPKDTVKLMTIHAAKGLEFSQVFIVGMEEGIFPNRMYLDTVEKLEEERRLAYVGITRAIKRLTFTYTKSRYLYGKKTFSTPSRFIAELPKECIKKINHYSEIDRNRENINHKFYNINNINKRKMTLTIGQYIYHKKFGKGKIMKVIIDNDSIQNRIQIAFKKGYDIKWLVTEYADIEILE